MTILPAPALCQRQVNLCDKVERDVIYGALYFCGVLKSTLLHYQVPPKTMVDTCHNFFRIYMNYFFSEYWETIFDNWDDIYVYIELAVDNMAYPDADDDFADIIQMISDAIRGKAPALLAS